MTRFGHLDFLGSSIFHSLQEWTIDYYLIFCVCFCKTCAAAVIAQDLKDFNTACVCLPAVKGEAGLISFACFSCIIADFLFAKLTSNTRESAAAAANQIYETTFYYHHQQSFFQVLLESRHYHGCKLSFFRMARIELGLSKRLKLKFFKNKKRVSLTLFFEPFYSRQKWILQTWAQFLTSCSCRCIRSSWF